MNVFAALKELKNIAKSQTGPVPDSFQEPTLTLAPDPSPVPANPPVVPGIDAREEYPRSEPGSLPDEDAWQFEAPAICPDRTPIEWPEGGPWDYDMICRERGCYGCSFLELHWGSFTCNLDRKTRTESDNPDCPIKSDWPSRSGK